jgi:predicted Zn-dependent protease
MSHGPEDLQHIADQVVEIVGDRAEANVRVVRTRHGLTRFANSFIHQHVGEDTVSVAVTLAVDGRTASSSTTRVAEDDLRTLVDDTIESARLQPVDTHWPGATPPAAIDGSGNLDGETADCAPDRRAAGVKDFIDAGPELRSAGYLDTEADIVAFSSTAGQRATGGTSRATIDGIHQTERSAGSGHQTSVRFAELDPGRAGEVAADRARRSAAFVDVDPGRFEVVLHPEAVATMLIFLAFYGFNAKTHLEGQSFVTLGEQQFDPSITLVEDPADPRAIALPFDAEGTPRQRFALVEDGVTRALAHDRRTARRAGTTTTGSAVPGGEAFGAVPLNVVMPGGDTPPEAMVTDVERGLLVTSFHYCRVLDPKSQVVTGLTRNGTFLIEDGELVGAVGNLRYTQSFLEALGEGRVLAVGDDDRYADSEFGAGRVICPSLRLAEWNFTGGARG